MEKDKRKIKRVGAFQILAFVGSGIYQPPPQPPQQLKQPQQPPKPPKPPKPPPHAHAWWVDTTGPAANSNTAADYYRW
ncbi:MAG: hypothetical protein WAK17_00810 [Candidatus Nitrosopolaris sp.]